MNSLLIISLLSARSLVCTPVCVQFRLQPAPEVQLLGDLVLRKLTDQYLLFVSVCWIM